VPALIDVAGKIKGDEPVPEIFATEYGDKLNAIFRAVQRERSSPRAGTASTLHRDEVRGGGKKPWRQKGTGRARQGSIRSPQWRHGGVVFGPKPRSYVSDLNKKERRIAFIAALADRFQKDAVTFLDVSEFNLTKTRDLAALLYGGAKARKDRPATLLIYAQDEHGSIGEKLHLIGRNLQGVGITHAGALDVKDVLKFSRLVFTTAACDEIRKRLERGAS